MTIDLSLLPAPDIIEPLDYEAILAERRADLLALYPHAADVIDLESEPLNKLLQESAYREMILRNRVNDAARAVMLAYSTGADLEQLAANFGVKRLVITPGNNSTMPPTPEVLEQDGPLVSRAQSAFEGLSVAGPREAYKFHARSADGRVADVSAVTPQPAEVIVTVLSNIGDGTAPADLVAKVEAALNDEEVRPLGDRLTVQGASIVPYQVTATIYLDYGPESEPIVEAANQSITAYCTEQRRLGRHVNRSAIIAALHVEGVRKVDLTEPAADIAIDDSQAAHCTNIDILNGGVSG